MISQQALTNNRSNNFIASSRNVPEKVQLHIFGNTEPNVDQEELLDELGLKGIEFYFDNDLADLYKVRRN